MIIIRHSLHTDHQSISNIKIVMKLNKKYDGKINRKRTQQIRLKK